LFGEKQGFPFRFAGDEFIASLAARKVVYLKPPLSDLDKKHIVIILWLKTEMFNIIRMLELFFRW